MAEDNIQISTGIKIRGVARINGRFLVEGASFEGSWRREFEQVVNTLWEGKRAIDFSLGIASKPNWLYRLKYRTIVELPDELMNAPSVTMVLGPYGDVVIRQDKTAYLSWYPVGMKGWSHDLKPPESWSEHCSQNVIRHRGVSDIAAQTIQSIGNWFPAILKAKPILIDAGVICAYGNSDVDDARSALHGRSEVGVTSHDGYLSVDPGKLTMAPFFGELAASMVTSHI